MNFSIIIPLFNRPEEIDEPLSSLAQQSDKKFEVIIVEDGSTLKSNHVVEKYHNKLPIIYIEKQNSGPGLSRNAGAEKASHEWLIFFDSDCIIPKDYIKNVSSFLKIHSFDAYGGPDAALPTFTVVQKAINYSMTSFLTTGGIRGKKRSMDKFHPRSFNLGVSKSAFQAVGGYRNMRFGEDIDFSLRLLKEGYNTVLIPQAFVYHKRRSTFKQFFKQVYNSGIARINLHLMHPGSLKAVHALPSCFVIFMAAILILSAIVPALLLIPLVYSALIFTGSWVKNRSVHVAFYSIAAAWIQLVGYGTGFLVAAWRRLIRKEEEFRAFEKKFYE